MSLLNNNTKALELVSKLSREELAVRLGSREAVSGFVTASIRNTDTERRKEQLLHLNPAGIVAGLKALTVLTGAQGAVIVTLAEGAEDALLKAADEAGLTLCIEKKADLVKFDHRDDLLVTLDAPPWPQRSAERRRGFWLPWRTAIWKNCRPRPGCQSC